MPAVAPHASLGLGLEKDPLPARFDFISDPIDLDTTAADRLLARVRESLPGAELKSLRRFANRSLWERFVFQRDRVIAAQNDGNPNVKLLFHGTEDPSLILGSGLQANGNGFDPRVCRGGAYGSGAYFATHALYPVRIFPQCRNLDGTFDLIVAEVACGSIYDFRDEVNPFHALIGMRKKPTDHRVTDRWTTQAGGSSGRRLGKATCCMILYEAPRTQSARNMALSSTASSTSCTTKASHTRTS